ncbi:hypothetical protein [Martelella endophytica]|uniref:hypothetical protein n=1 Tax=Martelella endophytica TaxID=1486262 RepID=UPI0005F233E5|nr:hypothetical protein [Martelella endophytica]
MLAKTHPAHQHTHLPSKARLALFLILAVYPVITALLYGVATFTRSWPLWQRTLIVTPIMVLLMVYFVMPAVHRVFARFILRPVRT